MNKIILKFYKMFFKILWKFIVIVILIVSIPSVLLIDSWMMKITVALFAGCCIVFLLMHKEFVYNMVQEVCVIENTFIFTTLRPTTITCDFKEIIRVEDFILFTGKKISLTDKRKLYICNEIFKPKIIINGADFTNHMEYLFYDK